MASKESWGKMDFISAKIAERLGGLDFGKKTIKVFIGRRSYGNRSRSSFAFQGF